MRSNLTHTMIYIAHTLIISTYYRISAKFSFTKKNRNPNFDVFYYIANMLYLFLYFLYFSMIFVFLGKSNFKAHRYKIAKNLAIVKMIKILLKKKNNKVNCCRHKATFCDCATMRHQFALINGRNEVI